MKKILRRAMGATLALVMTVSLLSGCGSDYDPIQEAFGYPGSTVMMTVDGRELTASDLYFWMAQNADFAYEFFPAAGMEPDWSASIGSDLDMGTYVKEESKNSALQYNVLLAKAEEYGYSLTKEDETAYENELASAKAELGGDEAYDSFLKSMLLTPEGLKELSSVGVLYSHMAEGLCREGGEYAPTPEDLSAIVADQDLLSAKHILLLTTDMSTGEALPEADIAAKKATAEELLSQLQAITDPAQLESKFDALMNEYSEDTGLAANPDGYLFTAGEMVAEFEDATRALAVGQVSGIVESPYGFHIILRLDPLKAESILSQWQNQKMTELVTQWMEEAEVVTTEAFDTLTTADFYDTLLAYRETLVPAEDAAVPEEDGAEPEEAPATEDSADEEDSASEEEAPAE